jgi:hypothetical protein
VSHFFDIHIHHYRPYDIPCIVHPTPLMSWRCLCVWSLCRPHEHMVTWEDWDLGICLSRSQFSLDSYPSKSIFIFSITSLRHLHAATSLSMLSQPCYKADKCIMLNEQNPEIRPALERKSSFIDSFYKSPHQLSSGSMQQTLVSFLHTHVRDR